MSRHRSKYLHYSPGRNHLAEAEEARLSRPEDTADLNNGGPRGWVATHGSWLRVLAGLGG